MNHTLGSVVITSVVGRRSVSPYMSSVEVTLQKDGGRESKKPNKNYKPIDQLEYTKGDQF